MLVPNPGATIHHWHTWFPPGRTLIEHAHRSPSALRDRTMPAVLRNPEGDVVGLDVDLKSPPAVARVSGSAWIADCPLDGCAGAEYVNFAEPLFFCCECRNVQTAHRPIRVTLPEHRQEIEAVLLQRPAHETRHWFPHESVADLKRENKEHGL